jgi:hypothetical protein
MKKLVLSLMTADLALSLVGAAFADEPEGRIQQRKENQQARIAQDVKSGSLTAGETANLEHKEANLNKEIRQDRRANGGNLTNKEKRQINRQQNKLSRNIYRDKHNGKTQSK